MPEIKKTFSSGKMNKDLDERLIPNGEYRDALNVQVSTSEASDIGAVTNLLGNFDAFSQSPFYGSSSSTNQIAPDAQCIGCVVDERSDSFYWFIYHDTKSAILKYTNGQIRFIFVDTTNSVLEFTDQIITGINLIIGQDTDYLFWTDGKHEPKKLDVKLAEQGTHQGGHYNTRLVIPDRGIAYTSSVPFTKKYITVIKQNPKSKLLIDPVFEQTITATAEIEMDVNIGDNGEIEFDNFSPSDASFNDGDTVLMLEQGSALDIDESPQATIRIINSLGESKYNFKLLSKSDTSLPGGIPSTLTVFDCKKASLDSEIFPRKFVRFGYRYKYNSGEYSAFSPFTDPVFDTDVFEYSSRKAHNTAMENRLLSVKLRRFLTKETPLDVVQIDLLYTESDSPIVYIVDKIKPFDHRTIEQGILLSDRIGNFKNHWNANLYEVTSDLIYTAVPENQLIRDYDSVPITALAQEVTGSRIVYGNYEQNYNIDTTPILKADYESRYKENPIFKHLYQGNFTGLPQPEEQNRVSLKGYKSLKSIRDYQLGISYLDDYGRQTPIFTSNDSQFKIPKRHASAKMKITGRVVTDAPSWAKSFKIFVKETSTEYYNIALSRVYRAADGDLWLSFPSSERNKVDEDTFLILKKAAESNALLTEEYKYKVLAIENEAPEYIKEKIDRLVSLEVGDEGTPNNGLNVFGSNYPKADNRFFQIDDGEYDGTGAPDLAQIEEDIYISFRSFENDYTRRYKVSKVTGGNGNPYDITLEDVFDASDCAFIYQNFPPDYIDNAGDVSIVSGMQMIIYTGKDVALPEFQGVFFVKINANGADEELFLPSSEIEYEVGKNMYSHFFYDSNLLFNQPLFSNYTSTTDILDNVNAYDDYSGETAPSLDISNSKIEWKELAKFGANLSTPNPILLPGGSFGNASCGFFIDKAFYAGTAPTEHEESEEGFYTFYPSLGIETGVGPQGVSTGAYPTYGESYPSNLQQQLTGGPDLSGPGSSVDDNWDINMPQFGKGIYKEGSDWIIELSFISAVGPHADGADGQGYGLNSSWYFVFNNIMKSHLWEPQNNSEITEEYKDRYGGGNQSLQNIINRLEPESIFQFANSANGNKYRIKYVNIEKRYNFINFYHLTSAYYDVFATGTGNNPQQAWDNNDGNFRHAYRDFGNPLNRRITYKINLGQQDVSQEEILVSGVATPILEVAHTHQAIELQFLDVKIADETGNIISENPAIFETEPKKTADLDLYYEASEALPISLNSENVETFIPLGCVVKCPNRDGVTDPNNLTYVTKAVGNVITTNIAIGYSSLIGPPALNLPAVPLYFYREDGSYTTAFVDGIGTLPNEIILSSNVSKNPFALSWFNCFSFGNGVESNRIRDTFNEVIIDKGVKASSTTDFTYAREKRQNGLIFSGIYNSNTGVNNLNQFILAEGITKDLNPTYGSIQKLFQRRDDLISFCEDRIVSIKANKDTLFNADGSSNVIASSKVLGDATPFAGDYGISTNPESFAKDNYRVYFTDKQRGAVLRLSMDGITPISEYGMSTFFKYYLKNSPTLLGTYDNRKEEYNVTSPSPLNSTISYKEGDRGWVSFKSFVPEHGLSIGSEYFTFKNGIPYLHHANNVNRNNFYGVQYPSTIDVVLNDNPAVIKSFKTVKYEGSQSKVNQEISRVETGFYNLQDVDGWYVDLIKTDKQHGKVPEFIEKEGKWFNNIKGDESDRKTDEFSFQGIGKVKDIIVDLTQMPAVPGCTNPAATNYDPLATVDDGSCIFTPPPPPVVINGCMDPLANNYDPTATFDDGTCTFTPPTPVYGCTNPAAINYDPAANVDDGSCIPTISGCTDPNAINYYPGANFDDGSCIYNPVLGCTDPQATNYNPLATIDDGSCTYQPQPVQGCTDPAASNYDPLATVDDGSCVYPPISGCTDPQALNYDPLAVVDDGSCVYAPPPVQGCTDPTATNYDPYATVDDGSCVYGPPPPPPTYLRVQDLNDDDS